MNSTLTWQPCTSQNFWQEEASCSHVVQIYESEHEFLNLLKGFVTTGIEAGESVILIATEAHLAGLEKKLNYPAGQLETLRAEGRYIDLKAEEVLARFMVNDWPDYSLFMETTSEILRRARQGNRKVRAFREMVSLLWEQGKSGATIMLEQLWNMQCEKEPFTLYGAYPKSEFPQGSNASLHNICKHHSKIISGKGCSAGNLTYQNIPRS